MKKQSLFLAVSASIITLPGSGICISDWNLCHAVPPNKGAITAERTVINERLLTNVTAQLWKAIGSSETTIISPGNSRIPRCKFFNWHSRQT